MKRTISLIAVLVLLFCAAFGASAMNGNLLVDDADVLTEEEEAALLQKLQQVSADYDIDVVVVTTLDAMGKTAEEYADDFYDYGGYGRGENNSGILILADFDNRKIHISTCGDCIKAFDDYEIEAVLDAIWPDIEDGDYAAAFTRFAEEVEWYMYDWIHTPEPGPEPVPGPDPSTMTLKEKILYALERGALGSVGAGAVSALTATGIMKSKLRSVGSRYNARDYTRSGSLRLTESSDIFLYSHTITHTIPRNDGHSMGGGGGGGGGGSTHTSSSGVSHGGGGRSF